MKLFERWKLSRRNRREQARLEAMFRKRQLLDSLLLNPGLRMLKELSGEKKTVSSGCAGKLSKMASLPLRLLDRRPAFRVWRTQLLRRVVVKSLSLGLRMHFARSSRS